MGEAPGGNVGVVRAHQVHPDEETPITVLLEPADRSLGGFGVVRFAGEALLLVEAPVRRADHVGEEGRRRVTLVAEQLGEDLLGGVELFAVPAHAVGVRIHRGENRGERRPGSAALDDGVAK